MEKFNYRGGRGQKPMTLELNTNFLHYRIVSRIGAGGMGEVFLAEDSRLLRKVALKILPPEFTDNEQHLRRFEQEAQTASALNHPNIVTIFEVGAVNGLNFIATEFIEGQTLRQKMRQSLLTLNEALEIAQQVTSALVAAHHAGIVHRDIKPENIMVRPDGLTKVLDFGLAKPAAPDTDSVDNEAQTMARGLTKPGTILGTLHYMSPEQVRGLPLDARSDIFSLGVVIYEMLSGKGPFDRGTKGDVIAAILTENPPALLNAKQGVPPELQRILAKALQKDKDSRYQTSKDLLIDIKSLSRELDFNSQMGRTQEVAQHLTIPITRRRFSLLHALAMVFIAGLAISAVWWFAVKRTGQSEMLLASSLKTAEVASWRGAPGELYSTGAFSPDGMRVAFVTSGSGTRNIQVKQTSANAPPVQTTKDEFNNDGPIWSPDGEEIAFFSTRGNQFGIWRIPYLGGLPTLIRTVPDGGTRLRLWSKTGKLYYEAKQNLFALDLKSGQTTQPTNFDPSAPVNSVSIAPDETRIAYITTEAERWNLWVAPVASGGGARQIVSAATEIRNVVWHSDNRRILYSVPVDGVFQIFATDVGGSKPTQITFADNDSLALDVSADGTKILYGSSREESDVWGVRIAQAEEFAFASDINSELWPSVSPDGKFVAFQSIRNLSQGNNLFSGALRIKPTDSNAPPVQIVANGYLPTWSPDGKRLAFMRVVGETHNLWTIDATGGEEKQLTTSGLPLPDNTVLPYNRVHATYFSWSPDSSGIAYPTKRSGPQNIWLLATDGSSDTQLTNNSDPDVLLHSPIWSSDGKRIAYTSRSNKAVDGKINYEVWVVDAEKKVAKVVYRTENLSRLLGWSEDEAGLIIVTAKGKASLTEVSVTEVSVATGIARAITTQPSTYRYNIHLSADRRMIAFVSNLDGKDNIRVISTRGGTAKAITDNRDTRAYFSTLAWAPDGKIIFFGKQSRYSLLSMITNFR